MLQIKSYTLTEPTNAVSHVMPSLPGLDATTPATLIGVTDKGGTPKLLFLSDSDQPSQIVGQVFLAAEDANATTLPGTFLGSVVWSTGTVRHIFT